MDISLTISVSQVVDLVFFTTLVASSIWLFIILTGYGGSVGKSFRIIGWGALVFGLSRILQKFLMEFWGNYEGAITLLTHFFEAVSFVLILYGFRLFLRK